MKLQVISKDNPSEELFVTRLTRFLSIVAIHGIYENGSDTWTDAESGVLWLRDLLPTKLLKARVLAYDFSADRLAKPGQNSSEGILSCSTNLIAELAAERQLSECPERPIVFVCHGFGGILLERALAISKNSQAQSVQHRRSIYVSTWGILFFGTPHLGMSKEALLLSQHQDDSGPTHFMLQLMKDSDMLKEVADQFAPLMKQFRLFYLWEQLPSGSGQSATLMVEQESAAPPWYEAERCGILATHSGMVKFKNKSDTGFTVVLEALVRYCRKAPPIIESRWSHERKLLEEERLNEATAMLKYRPSFPFSISRNNTDITDINELYLVPRDPCHYFTGRTTYCSTLRSLLEPEDHKGRKRTRKVFFIHGLGGSGKSQFCLKFARDNRPRQVLLTVSPKSRSTNSRCSYWGVFWIDASSDENAESGFSYLGQQAGKGTSFTAGLHWLANRSERWLLIIDNADDPDMDVSKYFPPGDRGHVLVTTRNPRAIEYATIGHFHFRGMDPDEAVTLLLKSAGMFTKTEELSPERRVVAYSIASELGYLALALAHAGAAIRKNIYTLERYLDPYLSCRKRTLSLPRITSAEDANIITTWEIPFERISSRNSESYKDAVELLYVFAFMHFQSVPELVFRPASVGSLQQQHSQIHYPEVLEAVADWSETSNTRLKMALSILCDYSIIELDSSGNSYSMHPVVHEWARHRLSGVAPKQKLACAMTIIARAISPHEASGREFRRRLLPHIDSCLKTVMGLQPRYPENPREASELERFASVYAENGLWNEAQKWQTKVVNLRRSKLGQWHDDTTQAKINLSNILWNLFSVKETIEIQQGVIRSRWFFRPSLANWTTWPPWKPNHVPYCSALSNISLSLWLAGRLDWSRYTAERAVQGLSSRLGPDDPVTLNAMFNLARTYLHLNKAEESHRLLKTVVQKRKLFFGPDHPDTLMARNELGMALRVLGRLSAAEKIVANVLASRTKTLGEEHAYTLWSVNDLSKVLCDRGQGERAAQLLEAILDTVERTLGRAHVGMMMTKSNLARAYAISQRWAEAETLLAELVRTVPTDQTSWAHAVCGRIHVLTRLERFDEAERACERLLVAVEKEGILAREDPRMLATAQVLLGIYQAQGRLDSVADLKRRVPGVNEPQDGKDPLFKILYGGRENRPEERRGSGSVW